MTKAVTIAFLGDERDLATATGKVSKAVNAAADDAVKAGKRTDAAFESTAGHADNVASKGSQAAGALSGLGGLAATQGGALGAFGSAAVVAGTATQGLADAGDLLNVVTESTIVKTITKTAATVGSTIATAATTAATTAYTGAQWLLNAALDANPIGLIVVGLVALVAGMVIAYKKSTTFRNIINGVFSSITHAVGPFLNLLTHGIPNAVGGVVSFVKAHWKPILAIMTGPIGLLTLYVTSHIDSIRDKFNDVVSFVGGIPARLRNLVGRFGDAGSALIGAIVHGITSPLGGAGDIAANIINAVVDFLNDHLPHSLNTHIPGVGTVSLFPTIPHLARGGIVTGPTLALIGEGGHDEAVIPLDGRHRLGGNTYQINVTVPVGADRYAAAEAIVDLIEEYEAAS